MLPDFWEQDLKAALEEVQQVVNDELDRQFGQLVESLRDLLYELFNYPLERPWPDTLAIFAEYWTDRGLKLTPRTLDAIGQLIAEELAELEDVLDADSIDASVAADAASTAGVDDETQPAERAAAGEQSKGQVQSGADDASRATPHAQHNREKQSAATQRPQPSTAKQDTSEDIRSTAANAPRAKSTEPSNRNRQATSRNRRLATNYRIEWEGRFTPAEKERLLDSLNRMLARIRMMIREAKARLKAYLSDKRLSSCEKAFLAGSITNLIRVLKRVANGNQNLELYHEDLNDPDLFATTYRAFIWDAEIHFNDKPGKSKSWREMPARELDRLFFHELTHLYGTIDRDTNGTSINNAHALDAWYNGQANVLNGPGDFTLRRRARELCDQIKEIEKKIPPLIK